MVQYRRNRIDGGTYFFTVALRDRQARLLVDRIDALREAVRITLARQPFLIDAWVVMPEHLHAVWTLPSGDSDYSGRWRSIKARFTRLLAHAGTVQRNAEGEYDVWQRRFWEHTIRDALDFEKHVDYVHYNPVKHGVVRQARDWPHSTFHRYVGNGIYSKDWCGVEVNGYGDGYGE